jgi:hypothetical protein
MQTDRGAHIAAPIAFDANGKTYLLSPLQLVDLKELEHFLRQQPVEAIKPMLAGLSADMQKFLLEKAYEDGKAIRIGTSEFNQQSQSFDGISYMLWLSLRKTQPSLTREQAIDLLNNNVDELMPKINAAAGYSTEENPTMPGATMDPALIPPSTFDASTGK